MLARVVRSVAAQQPAKRALSSTAPASKAFQHPASAQSLSASVSSGELAWCEIYGIDYEQQVQEALEESPLLVKDVHRAIPSLTKTRAAPATGSATTATAPAANAGGDIWNVVFGASTA